MEAKLAKSNMTMSEEKEKYLREKQKLLEDLTEYQRRCTEMAASEVQLRAQITMYTDKYSEFQDTLTKSNQVFSSFKGEMEKVLKYTLFQLFSIIIIKIITPNLMVNGLDVQEN